MPNLSYSISTKHAFGLATALTLMAASSTTALAAAANTPVGYWKVSAFNDNSPAMTAAGSINICFLAGGKWYSPLPGLKGRWFQKGTDPNGNGDHVSINGNIKFWGLDVDEASQVDFVTADLMTGPWVEWVGYTSAAPMGSAWLRVKIDRLGTACPPEPPMAAQDAERRASSPRTSPLGIPLGTPFGEPPRN